MLDERPKLDTNISIKDFKEFYWLKTELVEFCKENGVTRGGGKLQIAKRIEEYINYGKIESSPKPNHQKPKSRFDWSNESLSLTTVITDNYRNSSNVREFFQTQTDRNFKFNVAFMNWMKTNTGKTLEDALRMWEDIRLKSVAIKKKDKISPQFEYNTYIRDFLAENGELQLKDAIKCWKIKRTIRGNNIYRDSDLKLLRRKV